MRLHSLALQNFRQHAETRIAFSGGLTGIIGANGAGKTTILEAIAWALYGNSATRGNRDTIRHARAGEKAPVRVELDFALGGHRYRVVRTLRSADVYLDNADEPLARTIRSTNAVLQRRLGMSRSEFFNTYFTGQKELDVMAALGPVERARFLARVLGYDRLSAAQGLLRERRRAVIAELTGLRSGMPDGPTLTERVAAAQTTLTNATAALERAEQQLATALATAERVGPAWKAAEQAREQAQLLEADRRVLEETVLAARRDVQRLHAERDRIASAREQLAPLSNEAATLDTLRTELEAMEALARAAGERRSLEVRATELEEEASRLSDRLGKLESAPQLEQEQRGSLDALRAQLATEGKALDDARTTWARDRQEAETRLEALRVQHEELAAQQKSLEGLGEDSPCPTCARPLGASYQEVLTLTTEQLDTVKVDGSYFRRRVQQLSQPNEAVRALETRRDAVQQRIVAAERRYSRIQAAVQEREQLHPQQQQLTERRLAVTQALAALPLGYDAGQHEALRERVRHVTDVAAKASALQGAVERAPVVAAQCAEAEAACVAAEQRLKDATTARDALGFDQARHQSLREEHGAALAAVQDAEVAATECRGVRSQAEAALRAAEAARTALVALQARAGTLEQERSLHDELDTAYTALREELNDQLRPELSELASTLLESLTDGRYGALELDEQYSVQVLEDGLPKAVLSGGEEDLCNLVLRLAISQMIAERAGQPFSLLILDEVFGSLDASRRESVLALLRRLHDRFEQVIVITHIEDVREGLDRVLTVTYDAESGSSRVHSSVGGAAGAEAAAWEAESSEVAMVAAGDAGSAEGAA